LLAIFSGYVIAIKADTLTLTNWYSNSVSIGKWYVTPKVYSSKLNNNSSFYFSQGVTTGIERWDNANIGIDVLEGSSSNHNICYYGGTVAELEAIDVFGTFASNINGRTTYASMSLDGYYTYNGSTKSCYSHSYMYCAIIDKNQTLATYKNIGIHELGHALGWHGHSSNASDVMYEFTSTTTTLSSRDKLQLSQLY